MIKASLLVCHITGVKMLMFLLVPVTFQQANGQEYVYSNEVSQSFGQNYVHNNGLPSVHGPDFVFNGGQPSSQGQIIPFNNGYPPSNLSNPPFMDQPPPAIPPSLNHAPIETPSVMVAPPSFYDVPPLKPNNPPTHQILLPPTPLSNIPPFNSQWFPPHEMMAALNSPPAQFDSPPFLFNVPHIMNGPPPPLPLVPPPVINTTPGVPVKTNYKTDAPHSARNAASQSQIASPHVNDHVYKEVEGPALKQQNIADQQVETQSQQQVESQSRQQQYQEPNKSIKQQVLQPEQSHKWEAPQQSQHLQPSSSTLEYEQPEIRRDSIFGTAPTVANNNHAQPSGSEYETLEVDTFVAPMSQKSVSVYYIQPQVHQQAMLSDLKTRLKQLQMYGTRQHPTYHASLPRTPTDPKSLLFVHNQQMLSNNLLQYMRSHTPQTQIYRPPNMNIYELMSSGKLNCINPNRLNNLNGMKWSTSICGLCLTPFNKELLVSGVCVCCM